MVLRMYEISIYESSTRIARVIRETPAAAWREAVSLANGLARGHGNTTKHGYLVTRCARGQRVVYERGIYRCAETFMRGLFSTEASLPKTV